MSEEAAGGRIFFSSRGRRVLTEDELKLVSVGIDIGSSTSHLIFSRITLERRGARYVVTCRETLHESDILLTPFDAEGGIDGMALGAFVADQYAGAGLTPEEIDTGALVLTGLAVRKSNAKAIAELFAHEAGKLVAVSAGDSLEAVMSAHGSGAAARSRDGESVINVDIGGGTSKVALCVGGDIVERTAADIGARIVIFDDDRRILAIERAGHWFAARLGLDLAVGAVLAEADARRLAAEMAQRLLAIVLGRATAADRELLRLEPLTGRPFDLLTLSGGVAEYAHGQDAPRFGDLGPLLAEAFVALAGAEGLAVVPSQERIRATVVGAAQYTVQVSGGTIFVSPMEMLPLRNVPVAAPVLPLDGEVVEADAVAAAIGDALRFLELDPALGALALAVRWRGSATFARLDAFCRGLCAALPGRTDPLVLVGDSDVGGLIGIHLRHELGYSGPLASLDGIEVKSLDHIDVGEILDSAGAAPVVIKSLVFPADDRLGRPA